MPQTLESYDAIPYPALAIPESHPRNLRSIALMLGLDAPPHESARILDLGCGVGGNILPIACDNPKATVVGVDLSIEQIRHGRELAAIAKANNLRLEHASITDVTPDWGQFDYIICHGVFSWVPREVRDHILRICHDNLSPRGVACISFNTYPYWHVRMIARDMLRFHTRGIADPIEKVRQGETFMRHLAESPMMRGKLWSQIIASELNQLAGRQPQYVLHEYFEDLNQPLYFEDAAKLFAENGLSYLADAAVPSPPRQLPADTQAQARRDGAGDFARGEQYADFFFARAFRHALVTSGKFEPDWQGVAARLPAMHLASELRSDANVSSTAPVKFSSPRGGLATADPRLKAALHALEQASPESMSFATMHHAVAAALGEQANDESRAALANGLLELWAVGLLEVTDVALPCVNSPSEKPIAAASARALAPHTELLTNTRHQTLTVSPRGRELLPLFDGTRTRAELAKVDPQSEQLLAELAKAAFLHA